MKKLLIAAAVVCAAAFANAATANWGVGFIEDEDGNLLDSSSVGYTATIKIYSDAAMTDLITSSSSSDWDSGFAEGVSADALVNSTDTDYYGQIVIDHAGQTMKSDEFKFTTSSMSDETYVYVMTDPNENVGIVKPDGSDFDGTNGAFETNGGGSWSSVPEPTSGLLLLLGVAGLALRRKHA